MLIHETWANSIKALMQKNKIIVDDAEAAEAEPVSGGSRMQVEKCANRSASSRVQSGPTLLVQESIGNPRKDFITESKHPLVLSQSKAAPLTNHNSLDPFKKETSSCHGAVPVNHARRSLCSREVPLIQIETDQREERVGESEHSPSKSSPLQEAEEHLKDENVPDVLRGGDTAVSACQNPSDSLDARDVAGAEVMAEGRAPDEFPNLSGSSGESTDSWSQLANEEDNPDDTSSFLQLSERSLRCNPGWVYMSNGNSSATSSLGTMDLDIYQEGISTSPMINELVEEKEILKGQSENVEGKPHSHNFDIQFACDSPWNA